MGINNGVGKRGHCVGLRHPQGSVTPKTLSATRRRAAVDHVQEELEVAQRRACRVLAGLEIAWTDMLLDRKMPFMDSAGPLSPA